MHQNRTSLALPESHIYHLFAPTSTSLDDAPLQTCVCKWHDDHEDTSEGIARRMLRHIREPGNVSLRQQSEIMWKVIAQTFKILRQIANKSSAYVFLSYVKNWPARWPISTFEQRDFKEKRSVKNPWIKICFLGGGQRMSVSVNFEFVYNLPWQTLQVTGQFCSIKCLMLAAVQKPYFR